MSLYYEAAAILANEEKVGGSLTSRIFKKKDLKSSAGQIFALIAEASKWSVVLKDVIEKTGLLAEERKLTPILALLLTHDLLLAKSGVAAAANHVLKLAITRHKARLSAEFTKARIRYGFPTLDAFREAINDGELDRKAGEPPKARHPRWVRVNAIKSTVARQLATTFAGYKQVDDLAEVRRARGHDKIYFEDPNIPNLLALPPKINLTRSNAYIKGEIIFQDKASCFPAYLLDLSPDDGDVIDGCAAPGNKTTHLAAIVSSEGRPGDEQKVIAFERDKVRTSTLQKMVKLASADNIVTVKAGCDFLTTKAGSDEYASVGGIVLDPSCSGTGIVGRDDAIVMHLPLAQTGSTLQNTNKSKKRKRGEEKLHGSDSQSVLNLDLDETTPEETPTEGKISERLTSLSNFQLHILTHAMRFENVQKITYSTCSIHFEENEGVVFQALASNVAKSRGWKILRRDSQVQGLKKWNRRGEWEDGKLSFEVAEDSRHEVLDACIRCDKGTDEGTMGFFVAGFVRDGSLHEEAPAKEDVGDEWNGFSDGENAEKEDEVQPSPVDQSKRRRKKKRQRPSSG